MISNHSISFASRKRQRKNLQKLKKNQRRKNRQRRRRWPSQHKSKMKKDPTSAPNALNRFLGRRTWNDTWSLIRMNAHLHASNAINGFAVPTIWKNMKLNIWKSSRISVITAKRHSAALNTYVTILQVDTQTMQLHLNVSNVNLCVRRQKNCDAIKNLILNMKLCVKCATNNLQRNWNWTNIPKYTMMNVHFCVPSAEWDLYGTIT